MPPPPPTPPKRKKKRKSRPDTVEKVLEAYPDVFADIINVLIYHGQTVVNPQFLADGPTAATYKAADGFISQKHRDLSMYDTSVSPACIVYGLENQTKPSPVMPVRVMGYDAASYDHSIQQTKAKNLSQGRQADFALEIHKDQKLSPVVTLTLYFGLKPWDGPRSLHDLLIVPEELKEFLPNYRTNVVEVAFLPPDTIEKFTSDFQIVALWFRARRLNAADNLRLHQKEWIHPEAILDFFYVFAEDHRYLTIKSQFIKRIRKGEKITMCTLIDSLLEEGMQEGKKEGMKEGLKKGMKEGRKKGRKEGLEEGMNEGLKKGTVQTRYQDLSSLILAGFSQERASSLLGFSQEELDGFMHWTQSQTPQNTTKR